MVFGGRRKAEKEKEDNIGRRKIFFCGEEKNGDGKVRKYLAKEDIYFLGKKKKKGNIWRRKIFFCGEEEKQKRKFIQ